MPHLLRSSFLGHQWIPRVTTIFLVLATSEAFLFETDAPSCANDNVCLTKECVAAAARMERYMDHTVDPCQDFYEFSCGRFMKETVLPSDKVRVTSFSYLDEQTTIKVRNLLESNLDPSDPKSFKDAKAMYDSCMDLDQIEERGDNYFKAYVANRLGNWPILSADWSEASFNPTDLLIQLAELGEGSLAYFAVLKDAVLDTSHVAIFDTPGFILDALENYFGPRDAPELMALEKFILETAKQMGQTDENSAKKDVKDMVDFEIQLAKAAKPTPEIDYSYIVKNPTTLGEFNKNFSGIIDWRKFYKYLFGRPGVDVYDITDGEKVLVSETKYFKQLQEILTMTPKRVIANYIIWNFIYSHQGTLGSKYRALKTEFRQVLTGQKSNPPRFKTCVSTVSSFMTHAVGRMFIDEYFPSSSKRSALSMIDRIQDVLNKTIQSSPWLDDATKAAASVKDAYIVSRIGYADSIKNNTFLDGFYVNHRYNESTFFENILIGEKDIIKSKLRLLREPKDVDLPKPPPTTVNAFYNPVENSITFPAGILQPPFFQANVPMYMNFGGIGVVVAHEVGHGFDNSGRKFDQFGHAKDWWTERAAEIYVNKTQCFKDQFNGFDVRVDGKDYPVNGNKTLGENIADGQGMRLSHNAFREWVALNGGKEEQLLPGMALTPDQLFFLSFSQLFCTIQTPQMDILRTRTDVHSPGRFRVIGSVQNYQGFAKAFNCPLGSPMNPKNKCTIWG